MFWYRGKERFLVLYIYYISNSLIIHEVNTKEINTETEFGYVMKHLHKIKPTFISIFSLNIDLFEMLYQTLFLVFDILRETSAKIVYMAEQYILTLDEIIDIMDNLL